MASFHIAEVFILVIIKNSIIVEANKVDEITKAVREIKNVTQS